MLVPNPSSAEPFLRSIGRKFTAPRAHVRMWRLLDLNGNEIKAFTCWIDLWVFVLKESAITINEDRLTKFIVRAYRSATVGQRKDMQRWISEYHTSNHYRSRLHKKINSMGYKPVAVDTLPKSWKQQLRKVLASEFRDACFTFRAPIEMSRIDEQT